jgi:NAD(P)H-flavin reductase
VEIKGPLGYFVLRNPGRDAVFVATGTGIAPFRSMLKAHLGHGAHQRYTLVFGVRFEANLLYREEFEALERRHPNFEFWPTITRPDEGWSGRRGRVQAHLGEALETNRDVDVYICGMREMVDEVRALLKGFGLDRRQIIFEKYD